MILQSTLQNRTKNEEKLLCKNNIFSTVSNNNILIIFLIHPVINACRSKAFQMIRKK
jgi:hypothetical protein